MIDTELPRTPKSQNLEQALRESELKWRQLAETAPDFIISISREGKILFMNRPIGTASTADVIGKDAMNFVAPGHESTFTNALNKVFKECKPTEYEILSISSDQKPAWYSTRIAPVIIDGNVISATLITRDITERKKIEDELKHARDHLETIVTARIAEIQKGMSLLEATLESTADGILVIDTQRRTMTYNRKLLTMWSIDDQVLDNSTPGSTLAAVKGQLKNPEEFVEWTEEIYRHPLQKSADVLEFKDGRVFERYSQPQWLNSEVVGRVWSFRDVTKQRQTEAERDRLLLNEHHARVEAEKSVKARDEFLAIASHELRTPLTPLKMYLDWFKREAKKITVEMLPKAQVLMQALEHTDREISKLVHLTDDLLDVSRITAGRLLLNKEPMDLVELALHAQKQNLENANRRKYVISLSDNGPVNGVWDFNRLEQVVNCLLSNAIKYGSGKPVHISVTKVDDRAILQIEDQGMGIAAEDSEIIFQRFERASSFKNFDGLGLGLFISREIIQAHGGTINVKSEIGKGSTFTVSLPC